ncbi:hypothetical protein QJQ45_013706 [Haematococcus lacustris]|nr:hypothetical protein QJQ45_013706 [Haematococcus lacustris]
MKRRICLATPSATLSSPASDALLLLASRWEAQGHPLLAVRCLSALLQGAALLPDHEAKVRLSLGRLLVNHSCNFKDAERELLRVQALVGQLLGSYLLKCEVCFLLGRNYRSQGDVTSQVRSWAMQAYEQGLQACEAGKASRDRQLSQPSTLSAFLLRPPPFPSPPPSACHVFLHFPHQVHSLLVCVCLPRLLLLRWAACFRLHLADALAMLGDTAAALALLDQGCQAAGEAGLSQMQVVFMLFSLQLLLVVPDPKAFATRRRLTLDLIQALAPQNTGGAAGTPAQPPGANGAGPGAGGQGQGGPAGGLVRAGSGQSWSTAEGSAAAGGAAEQLPEGFLAYANCQLSLLEVLSDLARGRIFRLVDSPGHPGTPAPSSAPSQPGSGQQAAEQAAGCTQTPVQAAPGAPQGTHGGPQGLSPDSGGPAGGVKGRSQRHTLVAMASIRGMLDSTQGKAIGYHWLPLSSARALICLISAVLYAFTGKTQQAVDEITKGEAAVSEHLAELGVRHEEISEAALDPLTLWSSRPPLVLSLQLAVARAHLHLATSNLQGAQEAVLAVLSQVRMCMSYSQGCVRTCLERWCCIQALSLVSSPDSGEREVEAAIDALGPRFGAAPLTSQPEESLEGVVSMLAVALIKLRQGRGQEAAARLRTVLQAAHHRLMHHGLVAQVMAYLVPHQLQQSDLSAAEQMISAGLKMCKGIRSISTEAHLLAMDQQVWGTPLLSRSSLRRIPPMKPRVQPGRKTKPAAGKQGPPHGDDSVPGTLEAEVAEAARQAPPAAVLEAQRRRVALAAMLQLLEGGASSQVQLSQLAAPLTGEELMQVAEERSLAGKCGNPLCAEPASGVAAGAGAGASHTAVAGSRLKTSTQRAVRSGEVVELPGSCQFFCGQSCWQQLEEYAAQLGDPLKRLRPEGRTQLLSHGPRPGPSVAAAVGGVTTMLAEVVERLPDQAAKSAAEGAAALTAMAARSGAGESRAVEGYVPRSQAGVQAGVGAGAGGRGSLAVGKVGGPGQEGGGLPGKSQSSSRDRERSVRFAAPEGDEAGGGGAGAGGGPRGSRQGGGPGAAAHRDAKPVVWGLYVPGSLASPLGPPPAAVAQAAEAAMAGPPEAPGAGATGNGAGAGAGAGGGTGAGADVDPSLAAPAIGPSHPSSPLQPQAGATSTPGHVPPCLPGAPHPLPPALPPQEPLVSAGCSPGSGAPPAAGPPVLPNHPTSPAMGGPAAPPPQPGATARSWVQLVEDVSLPMPGAVTTSTTTHPSAVTHANNSPVLSGTDSLSGGQRLAPEDPVAPAPAAAAPEDPAAAPAVPAAPDYPAEQQRRQQQQQQAPPAANAQQQQQQQRYCHQQQRYAAPVLVFSIEEDEEGAEAHQVLAGQPLTSRPAALLPPPPPPQRQQQQGSSRGPGQALQAQQWPGQQRQGQQQRRGSSSSSSSSSSRVLKERRSVVLLPSPPTPKPVLLTSTTSSPVQTRTTSAAAPGPAPALGPVSPATTPSSALAGAQHTGHTLPDLDSAPLREQLPFEAVGDMASAGSGSRLVGDAPQLVHIRSSAPPGTSLMGQAQQVDYTQSVMQHYQESESSEDEEPLPEVAHRRGHTGKALHAPRTSGHTSHSSSHKHEYRAAMEGNGEEEEDENNAAGHGGWESVSDEGSESDGEGGHTDEASGAAGELPRRKAARLKTIGEEEEGWSDQDGEWGGDASDGAANSDDADLSYASAAPFFGPPPKAYRVTLSPFNMLWSLLSSWVTRHTLAYLATHDPQPAARQTTAGPAAGVGGQGQGGQEDGGVDQQQLQQPEDAVEGVMGCDLAGARDNRKAGGAGAGQPGLVAAKSALNPDSREMQARSALACQLECHVSEVSRVLHIGVPQSDIWQRLSEVLRTMVFPGPLPSLSQGQLRLLTLALLRALASARLSSLSQAFEASAAGVGTKGGGGEGGEQGPATSRLGTLLLDTGFSLPHLSALVDLLAHD